MSASEQRREPRVTHSFMARYRATEGGQASWFVSPLRDLSSGGARFISEYAFEVGTTLDMQPLLTTSEQPVPLKARVAWAKPGSLSLTEQGVTFNPEDTGMQHIIDTAVAHFLRKPQKKT